MLQYLLESYLRYHRGCDRQKLLTNIEKLNYYKQKPPLICQFLVNRHNEAELDAATEMAEKMGL